MKKRLKTINFIILLYVFSLFICSGCSSISSSLQEDPPMSQPLLKETIESTCTETGEQSSEEPNEESSDIASSARDNTPVVLVPVASGEITYGNDFLTFDASHSGEGYICISYYGENPKVKLQIIGPNQVTYTYNLRSTSFEVFPLTSGSGLYTVGVYENISGTQYATAFYQEFEVSIQNEFSPFLYPSQYVNFTPESQAVSKAQELSAGANSDLDVVSNVYNYIISTITYDYDKASNVASGYVCDVDETLNTKTGICLDYAALMTSMLRSQGIPTHLEVGYAKDAYHAWISTYIDQKGWVNGIIEFDGTSWSLMDPTFAANSSEKSLKKFIGEGSNYTVKYVY